MAMAYELPLYARCPRCRGSKLVFAVVETGDAWRPSRGEYFSCPECSGTGEADINDIIDKATEENEFDDLDDEAA